MFSDAYVLASLRRVGVPSMYLEDALQEVRILEWRTKPEGTQALHNIAVSALRMMPGYSRARRAFSDDDSLDSMVRTPVAAPYPSDELMDAERTINALPLTRRRAFAFLAAGMSPAEVARRMSLSPTRIGQYRREIRAKAIMR